MPVTFPLRTMRLSSRRAPVSVALLATVAALSAGCVAAAAPPVPVDRDRYEYSADGVSWGGVGSIPWNGTVPVPGGSPNATTFSLRASGTSSVEAEVYLGNWSVERGSAWFRVDVDGVSGEKVTVPGSRAAGPGVLMSEFSIPSGGSVRLTLNVGVPFGEAEQSVRIAPDWGVILREAGTPDTGTGSIGSGSAGSSGGGSSGSSGSGSLGSLGSPTVNGR